MYCSQSRPALELDGVWDFFIGMQEEEGRGRGSRFTRVKIEPPALLFLLKAVATGCPWLLARGLICLRRGRTYRNSSVASTLSRAAVACQCQVNYSC
jgi:hypothetical protein